MDKRKAKIAIAGGGKKSDYHEFFKDFNHPTTLGYCNDFYYFQYKGDVVYYYDLHVGLSYCMDIPEDYTIFETVNEANDYLKQLDMEEKAKADIKPLPRKVLVSDDEKNWHEFELVVVRGNESPMRYIIQTDPISTCLYAYKYMKEIPEAKKMTVPQIEEKLGYKIEVVE